MPWSLWVFYTLAVGLQLHGAILAPFPFCRGFRWEGACGLAWGPVFCQGLGQGLEHLGPEVGELRIQDAGVEESTVSIAGL